MITGSYFLIFVIIELINKTLSPVSSYIGGIYINEANEKKQCSFISTGIGRYAKESLTKDIQYLL